MGVGVSLRDVHFCGRPDLHCQCLLGGLSVGVCFEVEWMGIVVQSWVIRGSLGAGFGALANVAVLKHNGRG